MGGKNRLVKAIKDMTKDEYITHLELEKSNGLNYSILQSTKNSDRIKWKNAKRISFIRLTSFYFL